MSAIDKFQPHVPAAEKFDRQPKTSPPSSSAFLPRQEAVQFSRLYPPADRELFPEPAGGSDAGRGRGGPMLTSIPRQQSPPLRTHPCVRLTPEDGGE